MKKYIYDKDGNYLKCYFEGTPKEIEKQEKQEIHALNEYLGEKVIIENGKVRAFTRLDRIKANEDELQDGEYIEDEEIITVEKPNNFHFWNNKKNEWIYSKELEINALEEELGSLELEIYNKQNESKELKENNKIFAAKKITYQLF